MKIMAPEIRITLEEGPAEELEPRDYPGNTFALSEDRRTLYINAYGIGGSSGREWLRVFSQDKYAEAYEFIIKGWIVQLCDVDARVRLLAVEERQAMVEGWTGVPHSAAKEPSTEEAE